MLLFAQPFLYSTFLSEILQVVQIVNIFLGIPLEEETEKAQDTYRILCPPARE